MVRRTHVYLYIWGGGELGVVRVFRSACVRSRVQLERGEIVGEVGWMVLVYLFVLRACVCVCVCVNDFFKYIIWSVVLCDC